MRTGPGETLLSTISAATIAAAAVGAATALLFARLAIDIPNGPDRAALLLMMYASSACFSCILCHPGQQDTTLDSSRAGLLQAVVIVLVFIAAAAVDPQTRVMFAHILPITITLFLVLLALNAVLLALPRRAANAQAVVFVVVAGLFALPVWMGPLVEAAGNPMIFSNAVVAASPLSVFAVSVDLDYLRTSWFYQHCVLGSLRYDYLPWFAYIGVLATAIAVTAVTLFRKTLLPAIMDPQSGIRNRQRTIR